MVLRRLLDVGGSACFGAAGGGGTEKRARSCASVSRIRLVISWFCNSALVNILGGAKLDSAQNDAVGGCLGRAYCSSAIDAEQSEICSRWLSSSVMTDI
jgi:hypothetical protein